MGAVGEIPQALVLRVWGRVGWGLEGEGSQRRFKLWHVAWSKCGLAASLNLETPP